MATDDSIIREKIQSNIEIVPWSGCWIWIGSCNERGYGTLFLNAKNVLAHRMSYRTFVGEIENIYICHRCDVPACINPSHLFAGTPKDNTHDMMRKGRGRSCPPKGSKNITAKLSEADVLQILADRVGGLSIPKIATKMGVTRGCISQIFYGKSWSHLTGIPNPNKLVSARQALAEAVR